VKPAVHQRIPIRFVLVEHVGHVHGRHPDAARPIFPVPKPGESQYVSDSSRVNLGIPTDVYDYRPSLRSAGLSPTRESRCKFPPRHRIPHAASTDPRARSARTTGTWMSVRPRRGSRRSGSVAPVRCSSRAGITRRSSAHKEMGHAPSSGRIAVVPAHARLREDDGAGKQPDLFGSSTRVSPGWEGQVTGGAGCGTVRKSLSGGGNG
jgi:hypothetical protein